MLRAKKSLGQNFLRDHTVITKMLAAANVGAGDMVLEVGPGKGVLTAALLATGARVIAVEKDHRLIPELLERFRTNVAAGTLMLIEGDVMESTTQTEIRAMLPHVYKFIANIPYYITGILMRTYLESDKPPASMTLLVQKEVAVRVVAKDGKQSLLSLAVQYFGTPAYIATVKRGAFEPVQNVDSAILHIANIVPRDADAAQHFFGILHAAFQSKRKMLVGNLAGGLSLPRAQVEAAVLTTNLPLNIRAEDVPPSTWIALSKHLAP